jgi:SH3 domain protein
MLRILSVLVVLFAAAAAAQAQQTLYVSDELVITVRTGPSTKNAIVKTIRTGDAVQKLGENDAGDYYRVRVLSDGTEGWALSQYLTTNRAAKDRLADAQRQLSAAQDRVKDLQSKVSDLSGRVDSTQAALDKTTTQNKTLSQQLADIRSASAHALDLRNQNQTLRRRVADLNQTVDTLTMQTKELASRSRQNWFVVGAAVLFGGIVIGLVAPTLRKRRSSGW